MVARLLAALALAGAMLASPAAVAADEKLLLEVVINGRASGKVGTFIVRDGTPLASPDEWRDVGLRIPNDAPAIDGLVAATSLPGVSMRADPSAQTLIVTAPMASLLPAVVPVGSEVSGDVTIETGTGASLNYDLAGTTLLGAGTGTGTSASGLFDLRGFSPWGVASSSFLAYAGGSPKGPGTNAVIRLDSGYAYADPASLRRARVGDFVTGGLAWTRPVRLGGAQLTSDFTMRPDLVTYPLPSLSGAVAVPSTMDVMVNGTRLFSRQLEPGPFVVPSLPVMTGAGTVAMTLTGPDGRQINATLPIYAASTLLAPGLQTYAVEVGAVRRNWGVLSNDYRDLAASATWRRGIAQMLTIESHAETSPGQVMAGGGVAVNLFERAVFSAAVAASSAQRHTGSLVSVGIQRSGQVFSLGASLALASRGFRDLAAMQDDPAPRRQLSANAGLSLGRFGSAGVAYSGIDLDRTPAPINYFVPAGSFIGQGTVPGGTVSIQGGMVSFQPSQHAHIVSISYSVQVGNVALFATGFRDFATSRSSGVLFGLTVPLGPRSSLNASGGTQSGSRLGQVQVMQTPVAVGDWGYQAYAAAGQTNHQFAQAQYKSPWGLATGGADRIGGQTTLRAEGQGALTFADGGLFASNTITDSFAVVDTGGAPGIRVLNENREAGRTDASGRLLLPELRSFDVNHINIDPVDIAPDVAVPVTTREVRPNDRSGVVVRFPITPSRGALLRLVDAAGAPIPLGSTVTLGESGAVVPVGYDGAAYVTDLAGHNELTIERPDGQRCAVAFDYRAVPGNIPTIGPLACADGGR